MLKSLFCFVLSIVIVLLFMTVISGGIPGMILDVNLAVGMLFFIIFVLLISGTLKDFIDCFTIGSIKYKNETQENLRHSLGAVKLVINAELLLGTFLCLSAFIVTMYNQENLELVGKNLFTTLAAPLYSFLIAFVLYPVETIIKRRILIYSGDDEIETVFVYEKNSAEKTKTREKGVLYANVTKKTGKRLSKIIFVLCIFFFCALCVFFLGIKSFKNATSIPLPIDIPSLVGILLFVIMSLTFSGCLKEIILICMNKNTSRGNRVILCETLDLSIKSLLSGGVIMTIVSLIAVFSRLDTRMLLVPNTYVALLPISYSIVFSVVLLVIRMRINKR